ncbi:MAG: hypothetical protein JJ896_14410 [Rhodothermales bacterium]|nr:hypothetical protein [Rhodothermales bacterium]MBO6780843.1 hypothetical protein [Rhodothermales bacterium]
MTRVLSATILALALAAAAGAQAQPFVEVQAGESAVIISAPHGGYLTPDSLADRSCAGCVTVRDSRTQEWARALADELAMRTGVRPHVVINLLARTKLDANREIVEAADGDPWAEVAWQTYHDALEVASDVAVAEWGYGLVLDLHGHGHANPRFELGYLLSASALRESDAALDARGAQTSMLALLARSSAAPSALIRGQESLGELLVREGVPATPSATDPAPAEGEAFFSGGYITRRHGSRDGGQVDAVQLEAHFPGARDSEASIARLATDVAEAVANFLDAWYEQSVGVRQELPRRSSCVELRARMVRLLCEGPATVFDPLGRLLGRVGAGTSWHVPGHIAPGVYFIRYGSTIEPLVLGH